MSEPKKRQPHLPFLVKYEHQGEHYNCLVYAVNEVDARKRFRLRNPNLKAEWGVFDAKQSHIDLACLIAQRCRSLYGFGDANAERAKRKAMHVYGYLALGDEAERMGMESVFGVKGESE